MARKNKKDKYYKDKNTKTSGVSPENAEKTPSEKKAANQWFPYPVGKDGDYTIRASITTQDRLQATRILVTVVDKSLGCIAGQDFSDANGVASIRIPIFTESKKEIEIRADGTQLQPIPMTLRGPKPKPIELPNDLKNGFMNPFKAFVAFWRGLTTKRS